MVLSACWIKEITVRTVLRPANFCFFLIAPMLIKEITVRTVLRRLIVLARQGNSSIKEITVRTVLRLEMAYSFSSCSSD